MGNERYERQIMLPQINENGQRLLREASVAVIGAGGLGTPCLVYLALAGVGHITVCDGDSVARSNLNRQFLYRESDTGEKKALVAAKRLREINPDTEITAVPEFLTEKNADRILSGALLVLDCLDSFSARLILNDSCVRLGKTFIHAGVSGFSGQIMTCFPGKTPCLRCLGLSESSAEASFGILGAAAGVIGSMQALEAIKLLTGNKIFTGAAFFDGFAGELECLPLKQQRSCICNKK